MSERGREGGTEGGTCLETQDSSPEVAHFSLKWAALGFALCCAL